jgi:hypothetical protein
MITEFCIAWLVFGAGFWGGSWLSEPPALRYQIGFVGMLTMCILTTILWPLAIYERNKYPHGFWITGGNHE